MKFIHHRREGDAFEGFINVQNDAWVVGLVFNFYYYRVYTGWFRKERKAIFMIKKNYYDHV